MIIMEQVYYSYRDINKKVLEDVNMAFEEGKMYAIVGNSGEGKSTMLSILAGLDVPDRGVINSGGMI